MVHESRPSQERDELAKSGFKDSERYTIGLNDHDQLLAGVCFR